jgi:hypothetical protein
MVAHSAQCGHAGMSPGFLRADGGPVSRHHAAHPRVLGQVRRCELRIMVMEYRAQ